MSGYSRWGTTPHPLVGKTVQKVFLAEDRKALKFLLADGSEVKAWVDANCCSYTWIEELQGVDQLIGAVVTSVEGVNMPTPEGEVETSSGEDTVQFYGTKIHTDKGFMLIDYRNESNGYYGGDLVWDKEEEHYYGGVFGQAVSEEVWKEVEA